MYQKDFIPLESDPAIFSELIHNLGVENKLEFVEVYSLDDEAINDLCRPVLAVIVIFPDDADAVAGPAVTGFGKDCLTAEERNDVVWVKQTINNACGFYAALHAVCNGTAKNFIRSESIFDNIISASKKPGSDVPELIANSKQIEDEYANVAMKGSTRPGAATDEVECHYACFTKATSCRLWLLDGERDGPLARNETCGDDEDVLGTSNRKIIQAFLDEQGKGTSNNFAMMALVHAQT